MTAAGSPIRLDGPVLIVEDSRTQAEYFGHIMRSAGCEVMIAENGRIALEMIAKRRPAIIMSDILMPEVDGFDLTRRIRQDPALATIPVILVTQLFDPSDVLKGLEAGADNFIIKPFGPESVYSRIAEVMKNAGEPDHDENSPLLKTEFFGRSYTIRAGRLRILSILISTYDIAIKKNLEIQEAQDRLLTLNEQLQRMVDELQVANREMQEENTARERAERELAQANKKLQLMTSITRHDLMNQLTVLQGYLELAQMISATDPVKVPDYLDRCITVIGKTVSTVRFTGDYQKIGVNSPRWHDVSGLVERSRIYANPGTVRIESRFTGNFEIFADPLIEKVIFNLIDNALRYGAKLTYVRFSCRTEPDHAVLVCEDDGVGVPDEDKERIFTYGYGTNTGMGLFLVREILAMTDITITETGIPGNGARFEMRIPKGGFRVP